MTLSLSLSSSFKNNPGIFLLGGALLFSIVLSLYTTYKSSVLLKELNKSAHEILDLEKKSSYSSNDEILHVIKQEKEKENVTLDLTEEGNQTENQNENDKFDNFDNQNDNDNDNEIQIIPSKKTKKRKQ